MIWPFKREPVQSWEDFLAEQPEPACGQKEVHYHWIVSAGMSCPACSGDRKRAEQRASEERLADLIAERVAARLSSPILPQT